jgi:hypothetical protein
MLDVLGALGALGMGGVLVGRFARIAVGRRRLGGPRIGSMRLLHRLGRRGLRRRCSDDDFSIIEARRTRIGCGRLVRLVPFDARGGLVRRGCRLDDRFGTCLVVVVVVEADERLDRQRRVGRRYALGALGELRRRGHRLEAQRRAQLVLDQAGEQLGCGLLQETGRELVQETADLLGGVDEQACFLVGAVADHLRSRQGVLERAGEMRQVGEPDRRRAAGERMGQRDRRLAERPVQLHRPLGDFGHQATRQLVGFVEIDVEERNADAQRADDLDVFVARRRRLLGLARRERRGAPDVEIERYAGRRRRTRRRRQRLAARQVEQEAGRRGASVFARSARRERLEERLRLGRSTEIEIDRTAHEIEIGARERRLQRLVARIVEAIEHRRRGNVEMGQLVHRRWRCFGLVETRQVELESDLGSGLGDFGLGHRARELEVGTRRQVGRQADRQGDVGACLARLQAPRDTIRSDLDLALAALLVLLGGDVVDPACQIGKDPGGELEQRRLDGTLLGELRVVELLARPRSLAEGLQRDHPRAALEGVEGAPHGGQQAEVGRRVCELGRRLLRAGDHLARFLEEDLAHLLVVLEIADQDDRLHRRLGLVLGDRGEPGRFGRRGDEVDERFRQLASRRRHLAQVAGGVEQRFLCLQHRGRQRRLVGCLRFVREDLEVARHFL